MKKNLLLAFLLGVILTSLTINIVQAYDLSEFTSAQDYQLQNWWAAKWADYFGANMSFVSIPETGVMRGGSGEIEVKQITVTNGGHEQIVITPTSITCYDANTSVVCSIP